MYSLSKGFALTKNAQNTKGHQSISKFYYYPTREIYVRHKSSSDMLRTSVTHLRLTRQFHISQPKRQNRNLLWNISVPI